MPPPDDPTPPDRPDAHPDAPQRLPAHWEDLTPLGRLVLSVGFTGRVAATVLERGIDRAARIAADSRRAFHEGHTGTHDDDPERPR